MKTDYRKTIYACFIGYIVQAVVNSFVPLLFVTFQKTYAIPLSQITLLITINFVVQLLVDLLSAGFVDKIGYRASMIIAHIFAAVGLGMLTFMPDVCPDSFAVFGIRNWKIMTLIWMLLPIANMILFTRVPIYSLQEDGTKGMSLGELFKEKIFWMLMIMMLCAGASEQAVSQ